MDQLRFDVTRCYSQGREQQIRREGDVEFVYEGAQILRQRRRRRRKEQMQQQTVTITSMKCMFGMFSSEREYDSRTHTVTYLFRSSPLTLGI